VHIVQDAPCSANIVLPGVQISAFQAAIWSDPAGGSAARREFSILVAASIRPEIARV
jgi:hypothetical protein